MNRQSPWNALTPLATRMSKIVREHEVLRVATIIRGNDHSNLAANARAEVLRWTQRRCGGSLPKEGWDQQNFEYLSGGRNSMGVRIEKDGTDIWAVRTDDPDKTVPGRIWTTEIIVGRLGEDPPRFSTRLLASTSEGHLDIVPHTPGFVQQVSDVCNLFAGDYPISATPNVIDSREAAFALIDQMIDQKRRLPMFILTVSEKSKNASKPLLNADTLARATMGMAKIVVLPHVYTRLLIERFGRLSAVFGGGIRLYLPGFSEDSSPYNHKLIIAEQLSQPDKREQSERWIRSVAAYESIRRNRMGVDVLPFASIKSSSLELKQQRLVNEGASDIEQLETAKARIAALESQISDEKASLEYFSIEHENAETRAEAAEEQLRASTFRVQQLLDQIKDKGDVVDANIELPTSWNDFANWADVNLAGRVVLTPNARRLVKSPEFGDYNLVARCLLWLANDGRERRIKGGQGSIREEILEEGVRNAHCGKDEFEFDWQGKPYAADWHIKNGGNTRDPSRCLRIYYAWDQLTQQIVVTYLPGHRRTDAS